MLHGVSLRDDILQLEALWGGRHSHVNNHYYLLFCLYLLLSLYLTWTFSALNILL